MTSSPSFRRAPWRLVLPLRIATVPLIGLVLVTTGAGVAAAASPTTTTLALSSTTVPYGQRVYATVRTTGSGGEVAVGNVRLYDNGELAATVWCCSSSGEYVGLLLPRGDHVIHAEYAGSDSYEPSTSPNVTVTVTKAPTSVFFSGDNKAQVGQTAQVNVSAGPPGPNEGTASRVGTIVLAMDSVEIARAETDVYGYVELEVTAPNDGAEHTLTATYSGNDDFDPSSGTESFTSEPYRTTVWIGSSFGASPFDCPPPNPPPGCTKEVQQGTGSVSLAVYPNPGGSPPPPDVKPGGTATFRLDGGVFSTVAVAGENTAVSIAGLSLGRHSMSVAYSGNHAFTGGTTGVITFDVKPPPPPPRSGYWMVGEKGAVYAFGSARSYGNAPVGTARAVDIEATPDFNGYWVVDDVGHVFGFGNAAWFGNAPALPTGEQVASLSATRSGRGYWLFTTKGRAIAFGDAPHLADMYGRPLNGPILDSIRTASGSGYYMVGSDGGIFAFGDARFYGSMGGRPLNAPVRSLVPDPDGTGYWLVAGDGGVFSFEAGFRGSMGGKPLNKPMVGMVPYGNGYLMVGSDGGIFNFSDKPFAGSLGAAPPSVPIVGVAALNE